MGSILDDAIPWSITLDPDGVSGDTNLATDHDKQHVHSGAARHASELYASRKTSSSSKPPLSNTSRAAAALTICGWVSASPLRTEHNRWFSLPTGHRTPTASSPHPAAFRCSRWRGPIATPATFEDVENFPVQASRDPREPRRSSGSHLGGHGRDAIQLTSGWPRIKFVNPPIPQSPTLSSDRSRPISRPLTPYDTARQLHMAVMKALSYQYPPDYYDAVNVLADGQGDSGAIRRS